MDDVVAISDDARAIVLLCSSIASSRHEPTKPLGPAGWAKVADRLAARGLAAGALLGLPVAGDDGLAEILVGLDLDPERVAAQLARSGHLGFELERLAGRGVTVVTLADADYPSRLRARLGPKAPPLLFTAGDRSILDAGGVAVVGSRDVDAAGSEFARGIAASAAADGRVIVSGGARGVDQEAMAAAFEAGGRVAGLLPEGIERRLREPSTRAALADGMVALASPYHPGAAFSAGAAMGRNKLIYAIADVAVVVSSSTASGGTWAGAVETLKAGWVPVYVRTGDAVPEGNLRLVALGARPLVGPVAPAADAALDGAPADDAYPSADDTAPAHRAAEETPVQQSLFDL